MNCPNCQSVVPPTSKFCNECGHKILPIETFLNTKVEEHKLVTVLFSDISGYTAMSEKLDTEEVKDILEKIFSQLEQIVAKYGGKVQKYIGDAAMVVFGVPQVKEDDARRALKSLLEIRQIPKTVNTPELEATIGRKLSIHSGVNTGLVIVGNEKGGDGQIIGDPVNVAARLDSLAKGDEIMVGEETWQLCKSQFQFEELPLQKVKGKSAALRVFKLLGEHIQLTELKHQSKLIGREKEISILNNAFSRIKKGEANLLTIHAEAGGGKSRLLTEWKKQQEINPQNWLEGHAFSTTQNITWSLWANFLRRLWGIEITDDSKIVKSKIEKGMSAYGAQLEKFTPFIASIFGISYPENTNQDPAYVKERVFKGMLSILEFYSKKESTVLLLEDLHWADSSSLDLLYYLIKNIQKPILLIGLHRPHFQLFPPNISKDLGLFKHRDISLNRLSNEQVATLLQSILDDKNIPIALVQFIEAKIAGNPFYIEEFVNSLLERNQLVKEKDTWKLTINLEEANLPTTIEGIIRSRIDRLEGQTKRLLQQASVIGRTFYFEVLKRISDSKVSLDPQLNNLQQSEIIREHRLDPMVEYIFKHALLHEITYNSLLKKDRRQIHQKVAVIIETAFNNRLEDFYEILAYHYELAQNESKAIQFLMLAGKKTRDKIATKESMLFYKKAYTLITAKGMETDEERALLVEVLAGWFSLLFKMGYGTTISTIFEQHQSNIDASSDNALKGIIYANVAIVQANNLEGAKALLSINHSLALVNKTENQVAKVFTYLWASVIYTLCTKLEEGEKYATIAMDYFNKSGKDAAWIAADVALIGYSFIYMGKIQSGLAFLDNIIAKGKEQNLPSLTCCALNLKSEIFGMKGDYEQTVDYALQASRHPTETTTNKYSYMLAAIYLAKLGRVEAAEDYVKKFHEINIKEELRTFDSMIIVAEGLIQLKKGSMKPAFINSEKQINAYLNGEMTTYGLMVKFEYGLVLMDILLGRDKPPIKHILKNITFIIPLLMRLPKRIEKTFKELIDDCQKLKYPAVESKSWYQLGAFYLHKKKKKKAKICFEKSLELLKDLEINDYQEMAAKELARF